MAECTQIGAAMKEIYMAGGCFWGIEKLMQSIPGVTAAVSGYANGSRAEDAEYKTVCTGKTGFRETVKVLYDPGKVSLDALLYAYFRVVDPTQRNRQGNDVGSQYQAGLYYTNEEARQTVLRITAIEKRRYPVFYVEVEELKSFFPAEDYHQDYLDKNPDGYCHIPWTEIEAAANRIVDPGKYRRPEEEEIKEQIEKETYRVTQENGTEPPFENVYWDFNEKGVYVDAVTGEPLFSSKDKYNSSCGWPAFQAPIEEEVIVRKADSSHGLIRTEVRSRAGDSHLGHVFEQDTESPNGVRYCINSAALRFIPYDQMEQEGYGYLLDVVM